MKNHKTDSFATYVKFIPIEKCIQNLFLTHWEVEKIDKSVIGGNIRELLIAIQNLKTFHLRSYLLFLSTFAIYRNKINVHQLQRMRSCAWRLNCWRWNCKSELSNGRSNSLAKNEAETENKEVQKKYKNNERRNLYSFVVFYIFLLFYQLSVYNYHFIIDLFNQVKSIS